MKKTKYSIFGLKSQTRKITNHDLYINNIKIDRVYTYKYLGITLDVNLNNNKHLENVIKSISYKALILAKIRKYVTTDVAIRIYKTLILPVLEYGDILYDGTNKKLTGNSKPYRIDVFVHVFCLDNTFLLYYCIKCVASVTWKCAEKCICNYICLSKNIM